MPDGRWIASVRNWSGKRSGDVAPTLDKCKQHHATIRGQPATIKHDGLVGVTLEPWRPGLPVRQPGVVIADRHLDLRQTLFVEYLVLRDHLVQDEQVGGERVYLIGGESPLTPERHAAMDEIPHDR